MTGKVKVFISYSHKNEAKCQDIIEHLGSLRNEDIIETWTDHNIPAGAVWEDEITRALDAADLILLLVSPGFINSQFCYSIEMKRAVARHDAGLATVIPIAIVDCYWKPAPFSRFQGLPRGLKPISSLPEDQRDAAYVKVVEAIHQTVLAIAERKAKKPPETTDAPDTGGSQDGETKVVPTDRPKAPPTPIPTDREPPSADQPDWAEATGRDRFGQWASFTVPALGGTAPVTQRLRWVPPGRFLMGSPENEEGRDDDEGPQHAVTISRGFWLMDTACTQGLWQAVMGTNPSAFPISPDHPVEQVSWNDVRDFLARFNARIPGLGLTLPTEAQWEYACRAGTVTPFSFGATITPEQVNYGGRAKKTVPVASLPANPWGLYEMHGNVWEWCLDGKRTYEAKSETDPHGPLVAGGDRVIRGGSWSSDARLARAAYRARARPVNRYGALGFRCVPVQS